MTTNKNYNKLLIFCRKHLTMCINNWTRSTCCIRQSFVMEQRYLCSMTMELETIQQWLEKFSTSQKKDCRPHHKLLHAWLSKHAIDFTKALANALCIHFQMCINHWTEPIRCWCWCCHCCIMEQHWQWLEIDQKFLPLYNLPEERLEQTSQAFAWIWKHEVHMISLINHFKTSSRL